MDFDIVGAVSEIETIAVGQEFAIADASNVATDKAGGESGRASRSFV